MKKIQEQHLAFIKATALERIDKKYRKGAKEHKTILANFKARELLENAVDEAIDQVVYLLTLLTKIK